MPSLEVHAKFTDLALEQRAGQSRRRASQEVINANVDESETLFQDQLLKMHSTIYKNYPAESSGCPAGQSPAAEECGRSARRDLVRPTDDRPFRPFTAGKTGDCQAGQAL